MAIEHGMQLENGVFANTVGPAEAIEAMYPLWNANEPLIYTADILSTQANLTAINSTLRFEAAGDQIAILGNTIPRLCTVAADCGSCALASTGLSVAQMSEQNCARANTAVMFEAANQKPKGRYMLTAIGSDTFVVGEDTATVLEKNGDDLMYNKLPSAPSVVFTKSWAERQGIEELTVGINGADGSFGVASMNILGEDVFVAFCSMRDNMGDRGEDKQVVRKAINKYLDIFDMSETERARVIRELKVDVSIGASATLANFAHHIQIPEKGSKSDLEIREKYAHLVELANGEVTSAIVLEWQYPGAFERGAIFSEFEAKNGIRENPLTPTSCPGNGQSCHIDYRSETEYSLVTQLERMGVALGNIHYDDSKALDPSSGENNMASNRSEQNNGVDVSKTNRTFNGAKIYF